MANQPTIVVANLDDAKLKASIDKMVNDLNTGLNRMTENTDAAVRKMQASLQSLGDIKFSSGGSDGGSARRRAKENDVEAQSVRQKASALKDEASAYDLLAASKERSTRKKGIEYMSIPSDVQEGLTYLINLNKDVDAQLDVILRKEQELIAQKEKEAQITREIASQKGVTSEERRLQIESTTNEALRKSREILREISAESNTSNKSFVAKLESADRLTRKLKDLKAQYGELNYAQRNSDAGVQLAQNIRIVSRELQKLQAQMNRPANLKEAMGLSEKTLDDIAYKIRQLQSYRSGIQIFDQNGNTLKQGKREIQEVANEINRLEKEQRKLIGGNSNLISSNNALARSFNYMKNRLAFYFTVGASTQFVKQLIEVRSQYEMNERALGILLNSASRGTRIFNELSQMSLISPYTLIELSNAAKQLTAYDIAAKDVVDTTRRLADMASAVGVPVERLTYALGQIKAYGYLNSRDARMFANAGIPLVRELANYYSELRNKMVSTADVYDMMKKKAIDYNDVMNVVNKMTDEGGKFFDFQAKMADTLKVRLANLTLAWNNMLNDIGKDSQGLLTSSIKGLANLFKHWREFSRILQTVIVAFGVYKAVQTLTLTMGVKQIKTLAISFIGFVSSINSGATAMAAFRSVLMSIPFTAVATALATLISYFWLFNNSSDKVKEELDDIRNAFDGVRQEITKTFADAIKTDNIGTQLNKLRDILELAESELHVTIPINLEDVDEKNIKAKLKEAKAFIDEYLNFSQTFAEAAAGSELNTVFNEFGQKARSVYTSITESVNTVIVALQDLKDAGKATDDEIRIFNELLSGQREDEARIEYLQRLVSLYEKLGLIGKVSETSAYGMSGTYSNIAKLQNQQMQTLENLGIKNREVFSNMLNDVQDYYKYSTFAEYEFEQQVMRVAQKIDISNIPEEQRTVKLSAAINKEASFNNWNQFEKEFARQVANQKFGTNIAISDDSKKSSESELQEWQKKQQKWMDDHGIKVTLTFQTNDTEVSYAKRMLQEAKDAAEEYQTQLRKLERGTGSQEAVDKALKSKNEARQKYFAAGGDMSQLDKKENAARKKAIKEAESELQKALKEELQLIEKVRSAYKELTKAGVTHAEAVESSVSGYEKSVANINGVLKKYGLELDLSKFAGISNPHEILAMLQKQLDALTGKAKPAEIKALEVEIKKINLDVEKFDATKITDGLKNELGKVKDEYELALELDANPELGGMFAEMFGIDTSDFSHSIDDYMFKVQSAFEKARRELGYGVTIDVFKANDEEWKEWGEWVGLSGEALENFKAKFVGARDVAKKWAQDIVKQTQDLQYKLADNNGKIAIEEEKLAVLRQRLAQETSDKQKALLELQIRDQQNAINKLKEEILQLLPTYQRVFGEVAEHSAYMTRKLAKDYKNMLVEGKNRGLNADNTYSVKDPITGQIARISKDRMGKELKNADKELQKTQSTVKKITEAFTKGEDGVVDWVHGVELVGEELGKLGQFMDVVGNIVDAFGNPNEYNATAEAIHDIATSLQGVATAAQGIGQIASGDYIGGAVSVASGLFSAISSWFDNADKEILQQIKDSETAVKRLELAYIDLEHAVNEAYGMATIGANMAAKANKELQLVELKRQLALERSRDSKHRDEDKIIDMQKQIRELEYDIADTVDSIVNDLLGISSVGDAMENMMDAFVEALRSGEDAMATFDENVDEMIANMVKKMYVTKILQPWFEEQWNKIQEQINQRAGDIPEEIAKMQSKTSIAKSADTTDNNSLVEALRALGMSDDQIHLLNWYNEFGQLDHSGANARLKTAYDKMLKEAEQKEAELQKELTTATMPTTDDIRQYAELLRSGQPIMEENMQEVANFLRELGLMKDDASKNLSALQQGISQITEVTAQSLEAYANSISQQAYLRNDLLTQIRDEVVSMDMDVSLGVMSQILLQLQSSYQIQQSMLLTMENWTNPSGNAVRVELIS